MMKLFSLFNKSGRHCFVASTDEDAAKNFIIRYHRVRPGYKFARTVENIKCVEHTDTHEKTLQELLAENQECVAYTAHHAGVRHWEGILEIPPMSHIPGRDGIYFVNRNPWF